MTTVQQAIEKIKPGSRVFVHGGAATPHLLLKELARQAKRLAPLTLVHLHTEGKLPYLEPEVRKYIRVVNLFVGANMRAALDGDAIDYLPCFLSEIPALFKHKLCPIDVALVHLSEPNAQGYCNLGVSVDIAKAAIDAATTVIAQVNVQMPRIHGDGWVHRDTLDAAVECDEALPIAAPPKASATEIAIAKNIAELVEDGSTLQMGIGSIPDAVARCLKDHRNLGVHTEMWSDGTLDLIQSGAVTNGLKRVHRGKSVSAFLLGSKKLYDFVNDNPSVIQLESDYVNAPNTIARNPRVVAINSAVEIDLTGQVCADSVGSRIISGVGGQMDFLRGAALSPGGKPILAIPSLTAKGDSKIVAQLRPGAGVVTTRAHVHFVVTEHGVADLRGKTLGERAKALIAVAHPSVRDALQHHLKSQC